jgi:hypothetical protein
LNADSYYFVRVLAAAVLQASGLTLRSAPKKQNNTFKKDCQGYINVIRKQVGYENAKVGGIYKEGRINKERAAN